jgi:exonuclease III
VELNPGPNPNKNHFTLCSYNVNGIKEFKKLKRVTSFLNKLPFKNNCIINLQETHLTTKEVSKLDYQWKWGSCHSASTGASAGVSILYNKLFFDKIYNQYSDNEGRMCSITATKDDETYCFINIYAPNDHVQSLNFLRALNEYILVQVEQDPSLNVIISGDFNLVVDPNVDSIGRNQTKNENIAVNFLKQMMVRFNLVDSYRHLNTWGGFTWGRDNPKYIRSRLDMILLAKSLTNRLVESLTDKSPNESDHCFLSSSLSTSEFKYGKGIQRCNSTLLKKEEIKARIVKNLKNSIEEIPIHWNPHQKLDFVKVKIHDYLLEEGRIQSKEDKSELQHTNEEISSLNKALEQLLIKANSNNLSNEEFNATIKQIDSIKEAITIAEENISDLRNKEAQRLIFRSRAKWAEEGEKSTKYFLNLLKDRQKKMLIRKITSNGMTYFKQDEISKAIHKFYQNLYKKNENVQKTTLNHKFLEDLPKLDENDKLLLSQPITLDELKETLKTCEDSAPGIDGITYNTYKELWEIIGPFIKNAWDHSINVKHTSPSQQVSIITLLEKKDKDRSKIENLRPISLSNCDIKLCTKTLAIRTNKVLHKLISKTQTGYVPGRQVNDNSRLLEEIIQSFHNENKQAYLVTLDAQKAFDSVDHEYLLTCLKAYDFPDIYINQVKTIYSGLKAQVLVNGYLTKVFDIEQSVKQGDALSCALFILAIEPLLRQFEKN